MKDIKAVAKQRQLVDAFLQDNHNLLDENCYEWTAKEYEILGYRNDTPTGQYKTVIRQSGKGNDTKQLIFSEWPNEPAVSIDGVEISDETAVAKLQEALNRPYTKGEKLADGANSLLSKIRNKPKTVTDEIVLNPEEWQKRTVEGFVKSAEETGYRANYKPKYKVNENSIYPDIDDTYKVTTWDGKIAEIEFAGHINDIDDNVFNHILPATNRAVKSVSIDGTEISDVAMAEKIAKQFVPDAKAKNRLCNKKLAEYLVSDFVLNADKDKSSIGYYDDGLLTVQNDNSSTGHNLKIFFKNKPVRPDTIDCISDLSDTGYRVVLDDTEITDKATRAFVAEKYLLPKHEELIAKYSKEGILTKQAKNLLKENRKDLRAASRDFNLNTSGKKPLDIPEQAKSVRSADLAEARVSIVKDNVAIPQDAYKVIGCNSDKIMIPVKAKEVHIPNEGNFFVVSCKGVRNFLCGNGNPRYCEATEAKAALWSFSRPINAVENTYESLQITDIPEITLSGRFDKYVDKDKTVRYISQQGVSKTVLPKEIDIDDFKAVYKYLKENNPKAAKFMNDFIFNENKVTRDSVKSAPKSLNPNLAKQVANRRIRT